jgi:hypothetical protein
VHVPVDESRQLVPGVQQTGPHFVEPGPRLYSHALLGIGLAEPRNGFSRVAAAAPPTATPAALNTPRRVIGLASFRLSRSNS